MSKKTAKAETVRGPLDGQPEPENRAASEEEASETTAQAAADLADSEEFTYAIADRTVAFVLDEAIYKKDAVFGTAYLFIEKCYVYLTCPAEGQVGVRLRTRGEADEAALEEMAGEFVNELLNQMIRHSVGESTMRIREYYMARAFFATDTQTTIDDLLAELDDEELEEAPLEIAVPWEESDA